MEINDDEEYLSQEEIDRILNTKYVFDYYVYFDKDDGTIHALSNEILPQYDTSIQVEFEEIERFFNNTDQHFNFKVIFDADGKPSFVNKYIISNIRTNIIETIRITDDECILTVVWTPNGWEFVMSERFLQHPRAKSINSKLTFYVTLEENINRLVRPIELQLRNIVANGTVKVPFTTEQELHIDNISMFTLPFFESYGMKIKND
jgi:hypothetical protein